LTAGELAERATSVGARGRELIASVPAWFWLASLVALSASIRLELALDDPAPWIFSDEILYAELAESFGRDGSFSIRDVPGTNGFGFIYPLLIAPAYAVFERTPDAYTGVKAINAVVMSLAAVPTYLLARRVLPVGAAFLAAALAVAVPSMVYTGTVMTENAFYPVFLFCVLAMVLALERPSAVRQLAVLGLVGIAFLIRHQALTFLPALVTAVLVTRLVDASGTGERPFARAALRQLAAFRLTWFLIAAGGILILVRDAVRGRAVTDTLLGSYATIADSDYSVEAIARWTLYHVADIDLSVGVLPFAAFLLLVPIIWRAGELSRETRVLLSVSAAVSMWFLLVVAAFASTPFGQRIEERNLFYVAPLLFISLLVWLGRGLPRPPAATALAVAVAATLPAFLPYEEFVNNTAVHSTVGLLWLGRIEAGIVRLEHGEGLVVPACVGVALLLVVLPRRLALLAPTLVAAYLAMAQGPVESFTREASEEALRAGIGVRRDWIDAHVGPDSDVAALWAGGNFIALWENEFFNRSVGRLYNLGSFPDGLPQTTLLVDPATGLMRDASGNPGKADYFLSDRTLVVRGETVAHDPLLGMALYRVSGPLAALERVEGLYRDSLSGGQVVYTRYACRGGSVSILLTTFTALHRVPVSVVAMSNGKPVGSTTLVPGATRRPFRVRLYPQDGLCQTVFTVSPTLVPADVLGNDDRREIGVRFSTFLYRSPNGVE
jgi:hypothetical protein